nr:MAG TPA: hypothetical protein [Crassvirales sp.]
MYFSTAALVSLLYLTPSPSKASLTSTVILLKVFFKSAILVSFQSESDKVSISLFVPLYNNWFFLAATLFCSLSF